RNSLAVADALQDLRRNQRERLGVVELEAARPSAVGDLGGGEDQELLLLAGGEVHRWTSLLQGTGTRAVARPCPAAISVSDSPARDQSRGLPLRPARAPPHSPSVILLRAIRVVVSRSAPPVPRRNLRQWFSIYAVRVVSLRGQ